MWRLDLTDVFGMATGVILGLGFFALVAFLVYLFVYKRIKMNHEMRLEMIKQGREIPVDRDRMGSLKSGIVLTGVGLGLFVGLMMQAQAERVTPGGELVLALVPTFVGIGLMVFHLIAKLSARAEQRNPVRRYSSESVDS